MDQTNARIQDADDYQQLDLLARVKLDELEQSDRDELLRIAEYLANVSDPIDMIVLYEITGYRADSVENWNQYEQRYDQYESEYFFETGHSKVQANE